MKPIGLLALALSAACASARVTASDADRDAVHDSTVVTGPLRLEVKDFVAQPGVFFTLPSVTPSSGTIVVQNTRYGSLCQLAVAGSAQVDGHMIGLHIAFSERLTLCTAEIRALTYTATISQPAGTYDVAVIHEDGTRADTLVRRTVVVP